MIDPTSPLGDTLRALIAKLKRYGFAAGVEAPPTHLTDKRWIDADELAALVRAVPLGAAQDWQDIATAPERRKVLVTWVNALGKRRTALASFWPIGTLDMGDGCSEDDVDEDGKNVLAAWYEESEANDEDFWRLTELLTHWMPMPLPPAPVEPAAPRDHEADYWRCKACGCLWRDNHDGTVSLASANQTSCHECEATTPVACEPLRRLNKGVLGGQGLSSSEISAESGTEGACGVGIVADRDLSSVRSEADRRALLATVEEIAAFVEHLRDEYVCTTEPVGKVARLIRERFASPPAACGAASQEPTCPTCGAPTLKPGEKHAKMLPPTTRPEFFYEAEDDLPITFATTTAPGPSVSGPSMDYLNPSNPSPSEASAAVRPPPCQNGHEWSNQFGEDWTPDVGTPCDCRQKLWAAAVRPASTTTTIHNAVTPETMATILRPGAAVRPPEPKQLDEAFAALANATTDEENAVGEEPSRLKYRLPSKEQA